MKSTTSYKINEYKPDLTKQSTGRRMAHFLDWAARRYPRELFPKVVVAQAVFGLQSRVRRGSPQVEAVDNATGTARRVLIEQYKRDLFTERGVGLRATIDDQDALLNPYRVRVERADSAVRNVQLSASNIVIAKVPTNDQTRLLKESFRDITTATSALSALTKKLREQLALPAEKKNG